MKSHIISKVKSIGKGDVYGSLIVSTKLDIMGMIKLDEDMTPILDVLEERVDNPLVLNVLNYTHSSMCYSMDIQKITPYVERSMSRDVCDMSLPDLDFIHKVAMRFSEITLLNRLKSRIGLHYEYNPFARFMSDPEGVRGLCNILEVGIHPATGYGVEDCSDIIIHTIADNMSIGGRLSQGGPDFFFSTIPLWRYVSAGLTWSGRLVDELGSANFIIYDIMMQHNDLKGRMGLGVSGLFSCVKNSLENGSISPSLIDIIINYERHHIGMSFTRHDNVMRLIELSVNSNNLIKRMREGVAKVLDEDMYDASGDDVYLDGSL